MTFIKKILEKLYQPRDITSLVVFRVSLGAILLWEVVRYFERGWIKKYYIDPEFNFTYELFSWVKPWSGDGMYLHFYALGILSVLIMVGLLYRVAAILTFLAFTYVFLLEQAQYLNHFYLVSLISFLMIFIPANRSYSIDALIWKNIRVDQIPAWPVMLLQFQLGIAYFFGGVAKLNYDWLIFAEPMRHWLQEEMDFPLIGVFFDRPSIAYVMSWSGMFLDLLAPFLLLFRKTRPFMFAAIFAFHFMNDRLFSIGIFPWFMILASTIFFPADWLKKMVQAIKENHNNRSVLILLSAILFSIIGLYFHRRFEILPFLVSAFGGALLAWLFIDSFYSSPAPSSSGQKSRTASFTGSRITMALLAIWAFIQIMMPLRHYTIPGNVSWTEEGHRFAWHMKLRDKSGHVTFFAYDPDSGKKFKINHRKHLTNRQASKMSTRPYMIRQYAVYLRENFKKEDKGTHEVRVESYASLNYRPPQMLIDPDVNLAAMSYSDFTHNSWILQMNESLQPEPPDRQYENEEPQE